MEVHTPTTQTEGLSEPTLSLLLNTRQRLAHDGYAVSKQLSIFLAKNCGNNFTLSTRFLDNLHQSPTQSGEDYLVYLLVLPPFGVCRHEPRPHMQASLLDSPCGKSAFQYQLPAILSPSLKQLLPQGFAASAVVCILEDQDTEMNRPRSMVIVGAEVQQKIELTWNCIVQDHGDDQSDSCSCLKNGVRNVCTATHFR